jgi:hypothetical protein
LAKKTPEYHAKVIIRCHHIGKEFKSDSKNITFFSETSDFYLPHIEYEGSIGFVSGKIIADFHFLGLVMGEKPDKSRKIRLSPAITVRKICPTLSSL